METLRGTTVGFIGLGAMGKHMVKRIQAAGAITYAYHGLPAIRYEIARAGISLCASPAEIAGKTAGEIIIVMFGPDDDMDAAIQSNAGLLDNLAAGTLIIDMGKTPVTDTKRYAELAKRKGAAWVDAPAEGNETAASHGELEIAAGGSAEDYARALPVLKCLGSEITHAGEVGAGQSRLLALQN